MVEATRQAAAAEAAQLRADPPLWLMHVGDPVEPQAVLSPYGETTAPWPAEPSAAGGLWLEVGAVITAGPGLPEYDAPVRLRLHLPVGWPAPGSEPRLFFLSNIRLHGLRGGGLGEPEEWWYEALRRGARGRAAGLREALTQAHALLVERACPAQREAAAKNAARLRQSAKYRERGAVCAELFAAQLPAGGRRIVRPEWLAPELAAALAAPPAHRPGAVRGLVREELPGVYSFPCFSPAFCETLVAELRGFLSSGAAEDGTWCGAGNGGAADADCHGLVISDIGMEHFADDLQHRVFAPLAAELFPEQGRSLDRHRAFIVHYRERASLGLDMHTDDSDVTTNVCLGEDFAGAGLCFAHKAPPCAPPPQPPEKRQRLTGPSGVAPGPAAAAAGAPQLPGGAPPEAEPFRGGGPPAAPAAAAADVAGDEEEEEEEEDEEEEEEEAAGGLGAEAAAITLPLRGYEDFHCVRRYCHAKGRGLIHLGRHRHGADDLTRGERLNLVFWNYSIAWRLSRRHRDAPPPAAYRKEHEAPDPYAALSRSGLPRGRALPA